MINDGGCAVADAVNQWELGREQDILFAQRPVNFPPQFFEDFDEILRRFSWNGHAACHGRIEVMVCADKSGQDNLSGAVNRFGVRETALHFG